MPSQPSGAIASPIDSQAISAEHGGTRKKRAETREASLFLTSISSRLIASSELPTTR